MGKAASGFRTIGKALAHKCGAVAWEFALVAPILFLLFVGVLDFSRALWLDVTLDHAAQEGARFAAVRGAASDSPASEDEIASFVRNRAAGFLPGDLSVAVVWDPDAQPGSRVTVGVTAEVRFLLSVVLPIGPLTFAGQSAMTVS